MRLFRAGVIRVSAVNERTPLRELVGRELSQAHGMRSAVRVLGCFCHPSRGYIEQVPRTSARPYTRKKKEKKKNHVVLST